MKKKNKGKKSTAELIGIKQITEHGVTTEKGETVYFLIKPFNLSVLSSESLDAKIYGLTTVLKGISDIGFICLNSRENFEDNKRFLRKRLDEEANPTVRKLLTADLKDLDRMQVQMATSREFLVTVRIDEKSERDRGNLLNRIEKMLSDQGFMARLAVREDIKRVLAVYFEQNVTTERYENFDGERWFEC